jgi:hypothetical protein
MNDVGPVLESGRTTTAIIEALKRRNAQLEIVDKGSYQRILTQRKCTLLVADVEDILGTRFRIPQDLEKIMPSFQGEIIFDVDKVIWLAFTDENSPNQN